MEERLQIGCFVLDLNPLINALLPVAQGVLRSLCERIPQVLNGLFQGLIVDLDSISTKLGSVSNHLDEVLS